MSSNLTGPTTSELETSQSKIFKTLWEMKKNGYAELTIKTTSQRLRHLSKHCDMDEPDSIKSFIATKNCTKFYKQNLVNVYDRSCQVNEIEWSKPPIIVKH